MATTRIRKQIFNSQEWEFLQENCNYSTKDTIFLSFDIDWVPDYMLDDVADLVSHLDVSFMHTHGSPASSRIAEHFPSGIHPNLQKNSDQGENIDDAIKFLNDLNVSFETCRFHVLNFGYPDLTRLSEVGTKLDSSTLLFNGKNILPVYHHDLDIVIAPYFWEDGIFLKSKDHYKNKEIIDWKSPGLKIFDFHPLDIFLNTSSMLNRNAFKNSVSKLQETDQHFARKFIDKDNYGSRNILLDLIEKEQKGEISIKSLSTLNKEFRESML
tara:strand:- start:98 stop:904 length:807 start_codon:yes stop_codon:yes gene_type:complete